MPPQLLFLITDYMRLGKGDNGQEICDEEICKTKQRDVKQRMPNSLCQIVLNLKSILSRLTCKLKPILK